MQLFGNSLFSPNFYATSGNSCIFSKLLCNSLEIPVFSSNFYANFWKFLYFLQNFMQLFGNSLFSPNFYATFGNSCIFSKLLCRFLEITVFSPKFHATFWKFLYFLQTFMQLFGNSCIFSKILKTWRENLNVVKGFILVCLLADTGVDCGLLLTFKWPSLGWSDRPLQICSYTI